MHALGSIKASTTSKDLYLVGHNERAVKTNTELTNQTGVFFLVTTELLHERCGTGFGDGTQVVNDFLARHTNTVIFDGQRIGFIIRADADAQIRLIFQQLGLGNGLKAQLV